MRAEIKNGMTIHYPNDKYVVSNLDKEEIMCIMYSSRVTNWYDAYRQAPTVFDAAHEAMEEYAKQQSLLFTTFRENYQREERRRVKKEEERLGGMISWIGMPDDKIYDLFIADQITERKRE